MENTGYLKTMAENRRARHARVFRRRLKRKIHVRLRQPNRQDPVVAVRAFAVLAAICLIYGIGFVAVN